VFFTQGLHKTIRNSVE